MSEENITFRLDAEKSAALDMIATALNCDYSYLLNEAVRLCLNLHHWQIEEIQQRVAEADAGDFASDEEVDAVFVRLTRAVR